MTIKFCNFPNLSSFLNPHIFSKALLSINTVVNSVCFKINSIALIPKVSYNVTTIIEFN